MALKVPMTLKTARSVELGGVALTTSVQWRAGTLALFVAFGLLFALPANAGLLEGTPCEKDAVDVCGPVTQIRSKVMECLVFWAQRTTPECRAYLEMRTEEKHQRVADRRARYDQFCTAEVVRLCPSRPEAIRAQRGCLARFWDQLVPGCAEVVARGTDGFGQLATAEAGLVSVHDDLVGAEFMRPGKGYRKRIERYLREEARAAQ